MPVYERGKTTWRNRHSHSQAHPWQTHTSFFLSCLFMKEARPMKKWTFSDTQHQLFFFLFHLYLWKRQNARRNQHFFLLSPRHTTPALLFHACLWKRQTPWSCDSQAHPSHTPAFFPRPFMKSAKPTEKWAPETLFLTPIPDIQNQLRKLKEAKPMKKLAPETHSHAHPRHAKTSLGNWKRHNYQNKIKTTWPILVKVRHWSWKQWSINYPLLLSSKTMHKNIS